MTPIRIGLTLGILAAVFCSARSFAAHCDGNIFVTNVPLPLTSWFEGVDVAEGSHTLSIVGSCMGLVGTLTGVYMVQTINVASGLFTGFSNAIVSMAERSTITATGTCTLSLDGGTAQSFNAACF